MKSYLLILLGLVCGTSAWSQLAVQTGVVQAWQSQEVKVWKDAVQEFGARGWMANLGYHFPFKGEKYGLEIGLGAKQIFSEGTTNTFEFENRTTKLFLSLNGRYQVFPAWAVYLGLAAENNRDLEDFRFLTNDLFRFNLLTGVDFKLRPQLFLQLGYLRVLGPSVDVYLMTNPTDQLFLGVKYQLF